MIGHLAPNLGLVLETLSVPKSDPNFGGKQAAAWAHVRTALDSNVPCYGWELDVPEFYVLYGYDDAGYYYSGPGCDKGKGPKPWRDLGVSQIGWLQVSTVKAVPPAPDPKTVKEALQAALAHAQNPRGLAPPYRCGLAGYDVWAKALREGKADRFGQGYNGACWSECRRMAVRFLKEAKERLAGQAGAAFDEAIAAYAAVSENLETLAEQHPFQPPPAKGAPEETLADPEGADPLMDAAAAERKGLAALGAVIQAI